MWLVSHVLLCETLATLLEFSLLSASHALLHGSSFTDASFWASMDLLVFNFFTCVYSSHTNLLKHAWFFSLSFLPSHIEGSDLLDPH